MEKSAILTADVLDILFDGRNKEYGAYDLRKNYSKRLLMSITVMFSIVFLLFVGYAFAGKVPKKAILEVMTDINLQSVTPPEQQPELPPPPPPAKPPAAQQQVQTQRFTTMQIVRDDQVKPDEVPPANADLENVKIGTFTKDGDPDAGLITGPISDGVKDGVIELPKKDDAADDGIWRKVEIESEYPGGMPAWQRFLNRNLHFPDEALEKGVDGFVTVQFIVDQEGVVSNVLAVSGPEELRAEAIRVIKKSGKWTPAIQNGHKVKSYKRQPIGFRISQD